VLSTAGLITVATVRYCLLLKAYLGFPSAASSHAFEGKSFLGLQSLFAAWAPLATINENLELLSAETYPLARQGSGRRCAELTF